MALYTLRSGVNNHPEDSVLQALTDIVRKSGLLDPESDFQVVEPTGGGLNVDIGLGRAYVKGAATNTYPVRNTTTITKAIDANSSGSPRITSIVLYIDTSATPTAAGQATDVPKIAAVNGTPAGSPVAPDSSAIQASIGAGKPFVELAQVTVASGASGISNANIAMVAPRVYMKTPKTIAKPAFTSPLTPDYDTSDQYEVTLTGDITINEPSNMNIGDTIKISLIQNATGGHTPTWFSGISWMSPDYSPNESANARSVYMFTKTAAAVYEGYLVGKTY